MPTVGYKLHKKLGQTSTTSGSIPVSVPHILICFITILQKTQYILWYDEPLRTHHYIW